MKRAETLTDAVGAVVLAAVGVVLVVAGVLRWLPSAYALAGIALVAGVVAVVVALATRSGAVFWTALVAGAVLVTFGAVSLRFGGADAHALVPLLAGAFAVDAVVRLGACRELVALRAVLGASGALSWGMAVLVGAAVVPASVPGLGTLVGCSLVVTAGTLLAIGRTERTPARRR